MSRPAHRRLRALALGLTLAATGVLGAGVPASAEAVPSLRAPVAATALPGTAADTGPVGGAELVRAGVIVNLRPGVPAPPKMPSASWLVADMDTGAVLAAQAPHMRRLPASTLKVLTALTLIPRLAPDRQVTVTPQDVRADGTRVGLMPGTAYPVRTLFYGLLLASGNDAAYALADAAGGRAASLAAINAEAERLGAFDTVAKDPSGLDAPGQSSSAYDLALIGRQAMTLPDFRAYVATKQVNFPGGKDAHGKVRPNFVVGNHDRLLWNYAGAIGIKNGYTVKAGQTFIGAATRGGHTYIVSQMGGTNPSWRPTAALLDWAFANAGRVEPVGSLVAPGSLTRPSPDGSTPAPGAGTAGEVPGARAGGAAPAPEQGAAGVLPGSGAQAGSGALAASGPAGHGSGSPLRSWAAGAGLLAALALASVLGSVLARRSTRRHSP